MNTVNLPDQGGDTNCLDSSAIYSSLRANQAALRVNGVTRTKPADRGEVLLYRTEDSRTALDVRLVGETVWSSSSGGICP